jgi:hypothetical protein
LKNCGQRYLQEIRSVVKFAIGLKMDRSIGSIWSSFPTKIFMEK